MDIFVKDFKTKTLTSADVSNIILFNDVALPIPTKDCGAEVVFSDGERILHDRSVDTLIAENEGVFQPGGKMRDIIAGYAYVDEKDKGRTSVFRADAVTSVYASPFENGDQGKTVVSLRLEGNQSIALRLQTDFGDVVNRINAELPKKNRLQISGHRAARPEPVI